MKRKIVTLMIVCSIAAAVFGFMQAFASVPPAPPAPGNVERTLQSKASSSASYTDPPAGGAVLEPIPNENPLKIPWLTEEQKDKSEMAPQQ